MTWLRSGWCGSGKRGRLVIRTLFRRVAAACRDGEAARWVGRWFRAPAAEWLTPLLVLLAACGAVCHALVYRKTRIDDAWITFRYSYNLVHGYGPVYNPGQHVEGTSSFLFMLLVATGIAAGFEPIDIARSIGATSFALMTVVAFATVRRVVPHGGRILGLAAAFTVAASTALAVASQGGLETTFYALLVSTAVLLLVQPPGDPRRPFWALAMGLAAITRPEGPFFFALLLGLDLLWGAWRGPVRALPRSLLASLAWFGAVFGPVLCFRLVYYHAWLPNSVVAKSGTPTVFKDAHTLGAMWDGARKGAGLQEAQEYFRRLGLGGALLVGGIAHRRTAFACTVCLAIGASCVAVDVWNDGAWMGHYRLLTPATAPLDVGIALGLGALVYRFSAPRVLAQVGAAIPVLLVAGSVADGSYYERDFHPPLAAESYTDTIARRLEKVRRDDDWLATDMAGSFPYLSRLPTIDMFGLCDPYIARHGERWGVMGKLDWDYVIARKPTFYWFNFTSWIADLYKKPAFATQSDEYWALVTPEYRRYPGGDRKLLLVRRDRRDLARVVEALGATLVDPRDELRRLNQW